MNISNLIRQVSVSPTTEAALRETQRQLPENVGKAILELQKVIPESQMQSAKLVLQDLMVKVLLETDPTKAAETMRSIKAFLEHSFPDSPFLTPPDIARTADAEMAKSLFHSIDTGNIETWKDFTVNPEKHPEYIYFTGEMKNVLPNASENDIRDLFITLMKATVFELENKSSLDELRSRPPTFEPMETEGVDPNKALYATTRQLVSHRTTNPHYQEAFNMMKKLDVDQTMYHGWGIDSDPSQRSSSLWTGGKAVMEYASGDYRVLESSRLGKVFDKFEMHPDWRVQYPLWNLLSEGFVESDILRQVRSGADPVQLTYHLRADDPNSIGRLIELPTALTRCSEALSGTEQMPSFEVRMIPLISDSKARGGMRPLTAPITLTLSSEHFKEEISAGTVPIQMGLDAIIAISESIPSESSSSSTLEGAAVSASSSSSSSTGAAELSSSSRLSSSSYTDVRQLVQDNQFLINRRKSEIAAANRARARNLWNTARTAVIQNRPQDLWTQTITALREATSRYEAT